MEDQRVQRDAREAEPHPVQNGDGPYHLALNARLLSNLLDHHLGRRVADVSPTRRVEPEPGVGPLHEQQFAVVVADHRADGHLGGDVSRHPPAHGVHPLVDQSRRRHLPTGQGVCPGPDLGRHVEDLLVAFPLVERLSEPEAGTGRTGQSLGPPQQVPSDRGTTGWFGHASTVGAPIRSRTGPVRSRQPPSAALRARSLPGGLHR